MSELHNAMMKHMAYLVNEEYRPVSYKDFLRFEVDGIEHKMKHGTFRNEICKSIRVGEVEVAFRSRPVYYTLKGHKFGEPMTDSQAGAGASIQQNNFLYQMINNLPLDKTSIHNINLSFKVPTIWSILSPNSFFNINPKNKGLRTGFQYERLFTGIVIERTDTITVTIGCSLDPIPLDLNGIIHLSNALTIVGERLSRWVEESASSQGLVISISSKSRYSSSPCHSMLTLPTIPHYFTWIVTMWHLNADSLVTYSGKSFNIEFGRIHEVLTRIYSKQMKDGKVRARLERQEYPNKEYADLVEERLNKND